MAVGVAAVAAAEFLAGFLRKGCVLAEGGSTLSRQTVSEAVLGKKLGESKEVLRAAAAIAEAVGLLR